MTFAQGGRRKNYGFVVRLQGCQSKRRRRATKNVPRPKSQNGAIFFPVFCVLFVFFVDKFKQESLKRSQTGNPAWAL